MRNYKYSRWKPIGLATIVIIFLQLVTLFSCKKKEAPQVPGLITGDQHFCPGDSGLAYTVAAVEGANYYLWTVPEDSKIISGQGTTSIMIHFGKHSGTVCVKACNDDEQSGVSCLDVFQGGVSGQWCRETDFVGGKRAHGAGFSIGNKGYLATGIDDQTQFKNDLWEFDPLQNAWSQRASMPSYPRYDAFAFSADNKGYVGGGWNGNNYFSDFWQYDPQSNLWAQKDSFPPGPRCYSFSFSLGNKGYVGGGRPAGFSNPNPIDFWEYDTQTETWTSKAAVLAGSGLVSFSINGKGYAGLGTTGFPNKAFWEYDSQTNEWTQLTDFPGAARFSTAYFAIGSKGYVGMGYDLDFKYKDFYEFDPETNTWTTLMELPSGERGYVTSFVIGSAGYISCGSLQNGGTQPTNEVWVYGQ